MGAFGIYDQKATEEAFKQYLLEWKEYKIKSLRHKPTVGSPSMDGQPNDGTPHDIDAGIVRYVDDKRECKLREDCCHMLMDISEGDEILGDLLYHRFIMRWSPAKTLMYLNDKYRLYMDDRTFRRKQKRALWEGAMICKDETVRVLKPEYAN